MACRYFECEKIGDEGICEEVDDECLGDMCEDFQACRSCRKQDGSECPEQ